MLCLLSHWGGGGTASPVPWPSSSTASPAPGKYSEASAASLRFRVTCSPPTIARRRGRGRLQHVSVRDAGLARLFDVVFGSLDSDTPLFPASPSSFRRRWNRLLQVVLDVPPHAGLIPGGLRGGGAVAAFQKGESIPGLLWPMRLKHMTTLESYLQEVTASTVVPQLSAECRSQVAAAAALFPSVLALKAPERPVGGHR